MIPENVNCDSDNSIICYFFIYLTAQCLIFVFQYMTFEVGYSCVLTECIISINVCCHRVCHVGASGFSSLNESRLLSDKDIRSHSGLVHTV